MQASRIANVSAAVLVGFDARTRDDSREGRAAPGVDDRDRARRHAVGLVARMAQLFEDVLWVGDAPRQALSVRHVSCRGDRRDFVTGIAAAIEAARGDRVILVGEGNRAASAELLLALVAWPEAAVVEAAEGAGLNPLPAIYRRDDLLARAREVLASDASCSSYERFVAGVEITVVPLSRLGLAGPPSPLFADPELESGLLS